MPLQCVVHTCTNRKKRYDKGLTDEERLKEIDNSFILHVFPKKNAALFKEWTRIITPYTAYPDEFVATVFSRVCSGHFTKEDYSLTYNGKPTLKAGAVPSVFINCTRRDGTGQGPYAQKKKRHEVLGAITCEALGCLSRQEELDDDDLPEGSKITFHKFPTLRTMLYKKWTKALGRKDSHKISQGHQQHYLCSLHFRRGDLVKGQGVFKQPRLRRTAVPTVFELPPQELMHLVEPSAPYLQPKVVLTRFDDPKLPKRIWKKKNKAPATIVYEYHAVNETPEAHVRLKEEVLDPEEEVARLRKLLEMMKAKVMSTSQKVKCLKISVTALKSQYLMERGDG